MGATIADRVFIATGAAVFHGAILGTESEVRVNGVVHLRTRLDPETTVPIGWVAVGAPAEILPPDRHEAIWAIQKPLDFTGFVYGVAGDGPDRMRAITEGMARSLAPHGWKGGP